MDSAQVVSRSNSDMLAISMIIDNTSMPSAARMEAIADYAARWYASTRLDPSTRSIGTAEYERRRAARTLFQAGKNTEARE